MTYRIDFHRRALKFLDVSGVSQEEISEIIAKAIKKFRGEDVNIDLAKLKGEWTGFHRIKFGDIRIIAEFNFQDRTVYI